LPLWTDFMKIAIAATPNETFPGDSPGPARPHLQQTASLRAPH
jgi:hypothetical protein